MVGERRMNASARAPASLSTALAATALALFGIGAGLVSAPAAESMLGAVPSRTRLSFPVCDPALNPSCARPLAELSFLGRRPQPSTSGP